MSRVESCGRLWLHLALLKQRELFTQKEILGCPSAARPHTEHKEMGEIVPMDDNVVTLCVNSRKMEAGMDMND